MAQKAGYSKHIHTVSFLDFTPENQVLHIITTGSHKQPQIYMEPIGSYPQIKEICIGVKAFHDKPRFNLIDIKTTDTEWPLIMVLQLNTVILP
eukprot:1130020_1